METITICFGKEALVKLHKVGGILTINGYKYKKQVIHFKSMLVTTDGKGNIRMNNIIYDKEIGE